MIREIANWLFYFKFGSDRGYPRIGAFLTAINIGVLLVPEPFLIRMGIDVASHWNELSDFMQYYLADMEHKNAAYVFWLMLPFTCVVNTLTVAVVYNLTDYERFLKRRKFIMENRLTLFEKNRKSPRTWRSDMVVAGLFMIALYIWGVFVYREPLSLAGDFIPEKNRLALLLIGGFSPLILFPLIITMLVAEARAVISASTQKEGVAG